MADAGVKDPLPRKVGYRSPPPRREGEVRNPWGRAGKPKPQIDFLDEEVTLQVSGQDQTMSRREALDHFQFAKASKGDAQATKMLLERSRLRQESGGKDDQAALSDDEQRVFDDYIRRHAKRGGGT